MKKTIILLLFIALAIQPKAQDLRSLWDNPPAESKPWVFWYWMNGAVTKEGITADLEAMKEIGIAGAYLMPIRGVPEEPYIIPSAEQLTPLWWEMVKFAFEEAGRLDLQIGYHLCDGFALAGGPWITPELSMQKVVWTTLNIKGKGVYPDELPVPESFEGYYRDIALFAYPAFEGEGVSTETIKPHITCSIADAEVGFLADTQSDETFRSEGPCWIQYSFDRPFTCRTIQIQPSGRNLQSQRFLIEASDDGIHFRPIVQLQPPRHGWQNDDFATTHTIPSTTARYFRFSYDPAGTEPGSEDLDTGKWKQTLKIKSIRLGAETRIHQYEGKNGEIWRVSPRTTEAQIDKGRCIDPKKMINITKHLDSNGKLNWEAPEGEWTILRIGHTSNGHTNATGGGGAGLECDKFNPEAIKLQFDSWFGKAIEMVGERLASEVLTVFHVDSWECGSQNWSASFPEEFRKRRGYDLYPYLPVMAGIPIESVGKTEDVLYDVRQTIAELVTDVFYKVLQAEAEAKGCRFSAESISPIITGDGMLHYQHADIPMGEFWLESPTHDKLNDVLDAVSGAHIYGKNIVQAEAFTQLRMMFTEYPGRLKTVQDRHYALGINRLAYHVFALNPWLDRRPGMTLDGIGLYFQRDQTWWKPARAWIEYASRCHALLQAGNPVVDVAVFTGEELPRRSLLPDRLLPFLPGIFGAKKVAEEQARLANAGLPTAEMPAGVTYSANITGAESWINALRGYQYDSLNPDVLLKASVKDKKIILPSGMEYSLLVIPGKHPMQPNPELMSDKVSRKLAQLSKKGAVIIKDELPYGESSFEPLGIPRDFIVTDSLGLYAEGIAYTHRQTGNADIYFISNQQGRPREVTVSLRSAGNIPEIWNPVTGRIREAKQWEIKDGRTILPLRLDAAESLFVVLQNPAAGTKGEEGNNRLQFSNPTPISTPWIVAFDSEARGPEKPVVFNTLTDWSEHSDERIRYYSGTALYTNHFDLMQRQKNERFFIQIDEVYNLARVIVNGKDCGVIWTKPFHVDITHAIRLGKNKIEIEVTNTWSNRLLGDRLSPPPQTEEQTWTNARYAPLQQQLVPSGITGRVTLFSSQTFTFAP